MCVKYRTQNDTILNLDVQIIKQLHLERDKVTSSGPPEENLSPPDQNPVTNSGLPEINSGPPERDKVRSPGAKPGSLKWGRIMKMGA